MSNQNVPYLLRRLRVAERVLGRNLARYMRSVDASSRKKLARLIADTEKQIQQLEAALTGGNGGGYQLSA